MQVLEIPITDIEIPSDRFRSVQATLASRDGKREMDELAESIKQFGLINAITVTQGTTKPYALETGAHRLYVVSKLLKLPTIHAKLESELTEFERRSRELDENIRRRQMSAAERVKAVAALHKLRSEQDPSWTQQQTAALIGSRRTADVSEAVNLAKLAEMFPEVANKAKSINQLTSHLRHKAAQILRVDQVSKDTKTNPVVATISEKILLGDSVQLIKSVPDEFCRAIITDPPFGVDYQNKVQGTVGMLTEYSDTTEDYERLLTMIPDLYRVLKPDGFLVWFHGISWYGDVVPFELGNHSANLRELAAGLKSGSLHPVAVANALEHAADLAADMRLGLKTRFAAAGFTVDEIPIVWDRSTGKSFTRRPDRYFARAYDVALMCIKGEPQVIKRNLPNVIHATPVESSQRDAVVERPIELYSQLIERLTVPGERVADFFVGAGGCPAAAAKLQRDFFGCELSPERRALAINKIAANLPRGT